MKRFIFSVFLILLTFAFIGCDITECNISVENNDDYGWNYDYLGYTAGEYAYSVWATENGYYYYMYDSGYCYGAY